MCYSARALFAKYVQSTYDCSCIARPCETQILLNGELGDFIIHRSGLRRGDPFLPTLFILVMDVLNSLVSRATEEDFLAFSNTASATLYFDFLLC
jgi:hypothetical protein